MNSGPKWSLRNGSQYQRLCARAGCGAAAAATLRFQPTQRQAWLVELDEHASRTQGDLCNRHAATLVLPRGWELHDERIVGAATPVVSGTVATPALKSGPAPGARRARVRRPAATAEERSGSGQLRSLEPDASTSSDRHDAGDVPTGAEPAVGAPAFGSGDDDDIEAALGAILDARTPLLRRAFRNAKPR
jgi:hypothetical protein